MTLLIQKKTDIKYLHYKVRKSYFFKYNFYNFFYKIQMLKCEALFVVFPLFTGTWRSRSRACARAHTRASTFTRCVEEERVCGVDNKGMQMTCRWLVNSIISSMCWQIKIARQTIVHSNTSPNTLTSFQLTKPSHTYNMSCSMKVWSWSPSYGLSKIEDTPRFVHFSFIWFHKNVSSCIIVENCLGRNEGLLF